MKQIRIIVAAGLLAVLGACASTTANLGDTTPTYQPPTAAQIEQNIATMQPAEFATWYNGQEQQAKRAGMATQLSARLREQSCLPYATGTRQMNVGSLPACGEVRDSMIVSVGITRPGLNGTVQTEYARVLVNPETGKPVRQVSGRVDVMEAFGRIAGKEMLAAARSGVPVLLDHTVKDRNKCTDCGTKISLSPISQSIAGATNENTNANSSGVKVKTGGAGSVDLSGLSGG